jgi:hypothetical protein
MSIRVTMRGRRTLGLQFPARFLRTLGEGLITRIRLRTKRGIDASGRPFQALSRRYGQRKADALGHRRADLEVSGRMLNDMVLRPRPNHLSIRFASGGATRASGGTFIQRSRSVSGADKAFWHNIAGAGRARVIREFFALSDADETWIIGEVDDEIRRQL